MNKTQLTLTFVAIVVTICLGAYALVVTDHYAKRTPRQRTVLIVLFFAFVVYIAYQMVTLDYGS